MENYSTYVDYLRNLTVEGQTNAAGRHKVIAALDGEASRELRRLLTIASLRNDGAFFTSSKLRNFALKSTAHRFDDQSRIFDPACGAGDLLIGAAENLPTCSSLEQTLEKWSAQLHGLDIHEQFVSACRKRLVLAAWHRHEFEGDSGILRQERWFSGIRVGCGLSEVGAYARATDVLMNPPYTSSVPSVTPSWGSGVVTSAALFLEQAAKMVAPGVRLVAILPEVLRCGARYERFRKQFEATARIISIRSFGLFDNDTDVDVFVLEAERSGSPLRQRTTWRRGIASGCQLLVEDYFDVKVGPVVHFRDSKHAGGSWPYLTSENAPPWGTVRDIAKRRRFTGRLFQAPFVAIRRTSRPNDSCRAVATVVAGTMKYAVDNHMIVCRPFDRTLRTCRALVESLRDAETSRALNRRIRCRHLTVGAVKSLSWSRDA